MATCEHLGDPCNEPVAEGSRFCQRHTEELQEKLAMSDQADNESDESFPASDPPANY